jgi:hypothetical protein
MAARSRRLQLVAAPLRRRQRAQVVRSRGAQTHRVAVASVERVPDRRRSERQGRRVPGAPVRAWSRALPLRAAA